MTNDNDLIDRVLNFDGLLEAEKITGSSYKEDDDTQRLGFGMHMLNAEMKKSLLSQAGDTHLRISLDGFLDIAVSQGFEVANAWGFKDYRGRDNGDEVWNTYMLMWHPLKGILLEIEGYNGDQIVNSAKIYFNLDTGDKGWPDLRLSGHYNTGAYDEGDRIMVGDIDVREGFVHTLNRLAESGTTLTEWVECAAFCLTNYAETHVDGNSYTNPDYPTHEQQMDTYDRLTTEKVNTLPENIRRSINWITHAEQKRIYNEKKAN